jgi:Rne/Rng family ribonuclease
MAKEICISSTPHETRLAILEDDQLAEIYYERENEYTLAGSIYNGRVTRVLPGMQSAFVDIGLERDAFLYVTDFLELEDQEESEELEKAASGSAGQAPREVRHADARGPRGDRNGQKQEQHGPRERRPEPVAEISAEPERSSSGPAVEEPGEQPAGEGARRWRGRRRRRGGRGHGGAPETGHEAAEDQGVPEAAEEPKPEHAAHAPAAQPVAATSPASSKFVLPGESLSKYGGAPVQSSGKSPEPQAPPRPASTFKPATLVERPIEWDGSGLLPGETLSRRRRPDPSPEVEDSAEPEAGISTDATEEESFEEHSELAPPPPHEADFRLVSSIPVGGAHGAAERAAAEPEPQPWSPPQSAAEPEPQPWSPPPAASETEPEPWAQPQPDEEAPRRQWRSDPIKVRLDFDDPDAHEIPEPVSIAAESSEEEEGHAESASGSGQPEGEGGTGESGSDRSASHRVDPLPPSGFRLFGMGGKKKKSDGVESEPTQAKAQVATAPAEPPAPGAAPTATVSGFAPGHGLVEEEVIEGEEYDVPAHHHHKADEHDIEDFEEETLQTQIRSGELGELLQEAHLDHHIQMAFGDKNGEEEDEEVGVEEEEEEEPQAAAVEAQPATGPRRERNVRGRRGRPDQGRRGRGVARRSAQTSDLPIISDLLKPNQEILVQIAKEPIAKKGARITSHIALPGRFLVFMPTVSHVGVSRKIASDEERHRLKRILISERGEASGGFIVRTAAEGASEEELRADLRFLLHLWEEIRQRSENSKSPSLIYHDLGLVERILRDQMSANFASIWVDSQEDYERIVRFLNHVSPSLTRRVKLYTKETPLFEHFGIQDEISKALRSKVWLKSGGSIVINQTEALVAIDINTGKYVGKSARLEDTILKTNLDAVPEIVRQIRLRDLGGIIVIDFIDMDERKNRFKVMAALEEALKTDRAPTKVLQFNDFGLVAITRKRVKQSLERTLSVPCPTCQATGMVKSPTTVANEIYIELRKMRKHFENSDVLLRVNPETVKVLKANNSIWLQEFEELVGKNILVKSDATLHPEQFDIQG